MTQVIERIFEAACVNDECRDCWVLNIMASAAAKAFEDADNNDAEAATVTDSEFAEMSAEMALDKRAKASKLIVAISTFQQDCCGTDLTGADNCPTYANMTPDDQLRTRFIMHDDSL